MKLSFNRIRPSQFRKRRREIEHRRLRRKTRSSLSQQLEPRMMLDAGGAVPPRTETFDNLVNTLVPRLQTSEEQSSALAVTPDGDTLVVFSGRDLVDDDGVFLRRFDGSDAEVRRLNQTTREAQERPSLAVYADGSYVVAWDGRGPGDQRGIFARWFGADDQPRTDEVLINQITAGLQKDVDVAVAADGTTVFVFSGTMGVEEPSGVFGRTFDSTGLALTDQFRVNEITTGTQDRPSVDMNDDHDVVVTWSSRENSQSRWSVAFRQFGDGDRFDPAGSVDAQVSQQQTAMVDAQASQSGSKVGIDDQGNFLVVWSGYVLPDDEAIGFSEATRPSEDDKMWSIYKRHYHADGTHKDAAPVEVNVATPGVQKDVDLDMADDGRYVMAWTSGIEDGNGWEVYAKVYDPDGGVAQTDYRVNLTAAGHQRYPVVGIGASPVVGWYGNGGVDGRGVWLDRPEVEKSPPFSGPGDQVIPEQTMLDIQLSALPAYPGQRIRFDLVPGQHPMGMVVDPQTGRLTWDTNELDGPTTVSVTVRAIDADAPDLFTPASFLVNVLEVNRPPVIQDVPDRTVDESVTVSFAVSSSDPDRPHNQRFYSLVDPPRPGMRIDPNTGVFRYDTTETDGGQTYDIQIRVTDDGVPRLSDDTTFTLAVTETIQPPVLQEVADIIVPEMRPITLSTIATDVDRDADGNPQTLAYSLDATSVGLGMTIDDSGVIRWTPTEVDGPDDFPVTVTVTDPDGLSDTESFNIQVTEINRNPLLQAIQDQNLPIDTSLSVTAIATDPDLPANGLRYSLDEASRIKGVTINPISGAIDWQSPTPGIHTVLVSVTDDGIPNLSDQIQFNVNVDSPQGEIEFDLIPAQRIDEETTLTFVAQARTNVPSGTVQYSLTGDAPIGLQIDSQTGVVTWTPTEAQGPDEYQVTFVATDTTDSTIRQSRRARIRVDEVNRAPTIRVPDNLAVTEGETIDVTVTATDPDIPANDLRYEFNGPVPAGMTINATTGRITYTTTEADGAPNGGNAIVVPVRVIDNGVPALSDAGEFTITVLEENLAPQVDAIPPQTIPEQTTLAFAVMATDPDVPSQTLSYQLDAASVAAGIEIDSFGRVRFTPTEEQGPGTFPVTVTVTDSGSPNLSTEVSTTITVLEVNRAPMLVQIPDQNLAIDDSLSVTAEATDPDIPLNQLRYSVDSSSRDKGISIDEFSGEILWADPATGVHAVTVIVTDNGSPNLSDEIQFNVSVDTPDLPPRITPPIDRRIDEQTELRFAIEAQPGVPGHRLGFTLGTDAPSGLTIDETTGEIAWVPDETQGPGTFRFAVFVTDLDQPTLTSSTRVNIIVDEVNRAPTLIVPPEMTVREGDSIDVTATATDPDIPANLLRFRFGASTPGGPTVPSGMTIDAVSGRIQYTTTEADGGTIIEVPVEVFDNGSPVLADSKVIRIGVTEINDPPPLTPIADVTIDEQTTWTLDAGTFDPDTPARRLTYSLDADSIAAGITVDADGGLAFTPTEAQGPGVFPVTLTVTEAGTEGLSVEQSFTITVLEINRRPQLDVINDITLPFGGSLDVTANASDPDLPQNTLRFSVDDASTTAGVMIDASTGNITWATPGVGVQTIAVTVTDTGSPELSDTVSFDVIVRQPTDPPVFDPIDPQVIPEEQPLTFDVDATAVIASRGVVYSLSVDAPDGMTIHPTTGDVSWTPTEIQGPQTLTVTIIATDAVDDTLRQTLRVSIDVLEVNRAPELTVPADITINEGDTFTGSATATDPDLPANTLRYEFVGSTPDGMTLDPNNGAIVWATDETDGGTQATVQIRVVDDGTPVLSDTKSFVITVAEVNQPPVIDPIPDHTMDEQTTLTVPTFASDPDVPANALSYQLNPEAIAAGIAIDGAGVVTFTPTEEQGPGEFSVTVTVQDDGSPMESTSAQFDIFVREVNRTPLLAPIGNFIVNGGETVDFTADGTDPDIPVNGLTYSIVGDAPPGFSFNSSSGEFSWTAPSMVDSQVFAFDVRVTDDGDPNLSTTRPVKIEVLPDLIRLVEETRFVTGYEQNVVIASGTQSLRVRFSDLDFDTTDAISINDAFEMSFVDNAGRPLVGIVAPDRDAFFNRTEGLVTLLGAGAFFDITTGEVNVDVSHLPVGTSGTFVMRLVNNDDDDTTGVTIYPGVEQISSSGSGEDLPGAASDQLITPPDYAPLADRPSKFYTNLDFKHLVDVTESLVPRYDYTTYDTDTELIAAGLTMENIGDYPVRGPILVTVTGITSPDAFPLAYAGVLPLDRSKVSASISDSLLGAPFYDVTDLIDSDGQLLPGDEANFQLRFGNESNERFDYVLNVLGSLNRAPEFQTLPPTSVRLGNDYVYPSEATDPDEDVLAYELIGGPDGLVIDPATGRVDWTPIADQVGTHNVTIRTSDPLGLTDTQQFPITVTDDAFNRPPVWTTDPIIDAYVGVEYVYESRGADPDFDALTYTVSTGPAGLEILAGPSDLTDATNLAGNVTWTPGPEHVGTYVPVTLVADDLISGQAIQDYRIYVHPNPSNSPPVIVTTPQIEFDFAGVLNDATGTVTPPLIELELAAGEVADVPVSVLVPPQLPKVDVFLLFDDTGSFSGVAPSLANAFPQVIDSLSAALPNVDLGFGVGRFEDYGGDSGYASEVNRPFILNQPILPASYSNLREEIVAALSRTAPGGGGDSPETLIEGLFQLATGAGFDGDNNGSLFDSGLPGQISTQTSPGFSGDVPPFIGVDFDALRANAIPFPIDTIVDVPSIPSLDSFALKLDLEAGDLIRLDSIISGSSTGLWSIVHPDDVLVTTQPIGTSRVFEATESGEYLFVLQSLGEVIPPTSANRAFFTPQVTSLPSGRQDTVLPAAGEMRDFTFTVAERSTFVFDAIDASGRVQWELRDDDGLIFQEAFEQRDPNAPDDEYFGDSDATRYPVDQVAHLDAGNYTLRIIGGNQPNELVSWKAIPIAAASVDAIAASLDESVSVPLAANETTLVTVTGTTGQAFQLPSGRVAAVFDADGLVIQDYVAFEDYSGYGAPTPTLEFGLDPRVHVLLQSSTSLNSSFTATSSGAARSYETPTIVPLGTSQAGTFLSEDQEDHYEIVLDQWQLVRFDQPTFRDFDFRLISAGGHHWVDSYGSSYDPDGTSFVGKDVLLPPGPHRLIISPGYEGQEFSYSSGDPGEPPVTIDYSFTINTSSPTGNSYVTPGSGAADGGNSGSVVFGPGTRGGAGFRSGAIPIILAATDISTAYQPDETDLIRGVGGVEVPISRLIAGGRGDTPGGRGASVQPTIDALISQGALVIGLANSAAANNAPRQTLEALATLTGAINASATAIDSNIEGDPIEPGDPMFFLIGNDPTALANGVTQAIAAAIESAPVNVDLVSSAFPDGFQNLTGLQTGVRPDTAVAFDTRFTGDGQAHVFDLQFVRPGSNETIGTIPVAINDKYRYDSRAIDPDDDPVTLELIGETHGATFDQDTGKVRWRPAAPGSYTFTLKASDPFGGVDTQTWTVVIGDIREENTAPQIDAIENRVVAIGDPLRIDVSATDPDVGDQLRYQFIGPALGGSVIPDGLMIEPTSGRIEWTPGGINIGSHGVTVRVTDGHGGLAETSFQIEVTPPQPADNHRPVTTSDPVEFAVAGDVYRYPFSATDADFDPLTYDKIVGPAGLVVDPIEGTVLWRPTVDDVGQHPILLKVDDGNGGVTLQSYDLWVGIPNDPPRITSTPVGPAVPGVAWTYQLTADDPNGDVVRFELSPESMPENATLDSATGLLTFTPAGVGSFRFDLLARDGRGGVDGQSFSLPVSDQSPPRITSEPTTPLTLGNTFTYTVVAIDANTADTVTLGLDDDSLARGANLTPAACPADAACTVAATVIFTPDSLGDFEFEITATDDAGNTGFQTFNLPVVAPSVPGNPPSIDRRPTGPAIQDQAWTYDVVASDPDQPDTATDPLTFSISDASPSNMTISDIGEITWTPSAADVTTTTADGGVLVDVIVTDNDGNTATQSFLLPVVDRDLSANQPPRVTSVPVGPATVGEPWSYPITVSDPEGDTFTITLDDDSIDAGVTIDPETRTVAWTPDEDDAFPPSERTIEITIVDEIGDGITQTFTLPVVLPTNEPPRITSVPTGPAVTGSTWVYVTRATDPENDRLTFTLDAGSIAAGLIIDSRTGRVTWQPATIGDQVIAVTATDTDGNAVTQSFELPVVDPPAPPSTTPLPGNSPPRFLSNPRGPARPGQAWIYNADAIDTDGDSVTYSLDAGSVSRGASIESVSGRIEWTPTAADVGGEHVFTVNAVDGRGGEAEQTFAIPVERINRAPRFHSQPLGPFSIGRAWTYTIDARDPDGDAITLTLDDVSTSAGFSLTNSVLTWTPLVAGDFAVTITAEDPDGAATTQSFTITVPAEATGGGGGGGGNGDPDLPPRFRSIPPRTSPLNQPIDYTADAFDPEGTAVTYALAAGPVGATIDRVTGILSYRPSRLGEVVFSVDAFDATGNSLRQTFPILVQAAPAANRPPELSGTLAGPAARDLPYQARITATDPDGDAVTMTLDQASIDAGLMLHPTDGRLIWTPDTEGDFAITITATDVHDAKDVETYSLTVIRNAPPQITSTPPRRVNLGDVLTYQVTAEDPNAGDTITFAADPPVGVPRGPGGVDISDAGLLTWTPTTAGQYGVRVRVADPHGGSDSQEFNILVIDPAVNNAPVIDGSPRTRLSFDREYVWQIPATDIDRDDLTFTLDEGPAGLTVDAAGLLQWTPTATQVTTDTPHSVKVTVDDGRGGTDTQTWPIHVRSTTGNTAPTITGDPRPIAVAGRVYQTLLTATDPDGDTILWNLDAGPTGAVVDARGLVQWIPKTTDVGDHTIIVRASDTAGGFDTYEFTLNVRAGNSPARIAGDPTPSHKTNTPYQVTFTATDPDGDVPKFRFVPGTEAHGASLDEVTGVLDWTPDTEGDFTFAVSAVDDFGAGTQLQFKVTVDSIGPNDPPQFDNTSPGIAEVGTRYQKTFPATDPDGDTLTYAIAEGPNGMTINAATGRVQWDAPESLVGQAVTVRLTATDVANQTANYSFTLPIRAANRDPQYTSDPVRTETAGRVYRYDVTATDPDFDPLTLSLTNAPDGIEFDIQTGRLTWATTPADVGTHTITVTLTDNRIPTPIDQSWQLTITPDEAPPEVRVSANRLDVGIGEEVSLRLVVIDNVGVEERSLLVDDTSLTLDAAGNARYAFDAAGRYTVTGTATDAAGLTAADTLEIFVRDPNNAAPRPAIISPAGGQSIHAPTDVSVTVTDEEMDLTAVRLLVAPADGSAEFRQIAAIVANDGETLGDITNQVIGKFDPTALANGSYILRLVAIDAGFNQASTDRFVEVEGRLKLGNFNIAFTDLEIPVAGIPITIVRKYDTLDATVVGDFGNGWSLEIQRAELSVDRSTTAPGGGFVDGTRVIVTTPDGREEGFTFRAVPDAYLFSTPLTYKPNFDSDSGNQYTLTAPGGGLKRVGSEYLSGYGTIYRPSHAEFGNAYELRSTLNKRIFPINASTGENSGVSDLNGNTLRFTRDGVVSDSGRNVIFQRDMQGRIARIVDPRGNALQYEYDSIGDLIAFTDRMGNRTTMTYHSSPQHYLDEVIDPVGNLAVKANYAVIEDSRGGGGGSGEPTPASAGRLSSLTDATGSSLKFTYDVDGLSQSSYDEDGLQSTVMFDEFGNPTQQVARGGQHVMMQFDDPESGLPTMQTQVIGDVDTPEQKAAGTGDDQELARTFNRWGQVTTETDHRGNVTRYYYDDRGVPNRTVNPDGSSTYYAYDDNQNLTFISPSTGGSTSMSYDDAGNVTTVLSGQYDSYGGGYGGYGDEDGSGNSGPQGNRIELEYNRFGDLVGTDDTDDNARVIEVDANGNQTGTQFVWTDTDGSGDSQTLSTVADVAANDQPAGNTNANGIATSVEFDHLNRPFRSYDENGLVTETLYDIRGLAVETRTQTLGEDGSAIWNVARTVYDEDGNVTFSAGSVPEGTPTEDIFGTRNVYDSAGRVIRTEQLRGLDIAITGSAPTYASAVVATGTVITSSETYHDAVGRVWQTVDNYGRKTQTLFDRFGQSIESRSQSTTQDGSIVWMTSRTFYDSLGRVTLSTDRFVMPAGTQLGEGDSPEVHGTRTIYDSQGRSIGSQRIEGLIVAGLPASDASPSGFEIIDEGRLLHESSTTYDSRGRIATQTSATGAITSYEYDSRDRQIATIGTPLAAEDVGLGSRFPGQFIRHRSEVEFNRYGQNAAQTVNIYQVEDAAGNVVETNRDDARTTTFDYDAFGRQIGMTYPDGSSMSTVYDDFGRVTAETNQMGQTRTFGYDDVGRLTSVTLPETTDPTTGQRTAPTYQYAYDSRGNQTLLKDPLGRETRFGFDDAGRQTSRTLPLGFGEDGLFGTADDPFTGDTATTFTEAFEYDDRGRVLLHTSFEGIVTAYEYDDIAAVGTIATGRMSAMHYFPSMPSYNADPTNPMETWSYFYDEFGRESRVVQTVHAVLDIPQQTRTITKSYDLQGRLVDHTTAEGRIGYTYNDLGQKTATLVYGKTSLSDTDYQTATKPDRGTFYTYDILGRLETVTERNLTLPLGGSSESEGRADQTHVYDYDLLGNLDGELAANGVYSDYVYDSLSRLDTLTHYRTDGTAADIADLTDNDVIVKFDYTVRDDGRRIGVEETWWLDLDSDGTDEPNVATYTYGYDELNRLVDEAFDHWDDSLDYADTFTYDLTGNRLQTTRDELADGTIDQVTRYEVDVNDRLIQEFEYHRDDTDAGDWGEGGITEDLSQADATTTHTHDATQNTGRVTVDADGNTTLSHVYTYDLQGRMQTATVTNYENGVASSITRSTYDYDHTGIRVSTLNETDADADGVFESSVKIEYLVDHANHTGYQQVIRETHYDPQTGNRLKVIDYTFGLDEISQTTIEYDGDGNEISRRTDWFLHDGKANVRALLDAAGRILELATADAAQQLYFYDAYGNLLGLTAAQAATNLLYNGEQFDALTGNQYLRARYYNPQSGTFNRLDPFFGNHQDPQSFHKYAYVHGDPINGSDPTGEFLLAAGLFIGLGIFAFSAGVGFFTAGVGFLSGEFTFSQAIGVFAKYAAIGALGGLAIGLLVAFAPVILPFVGAHLAAASLIVGSGVIGIGAASYFSGGPQALLTGLNQWIPPWGDAAASKYQHEIIASANTHGVPPELLASILTAERLDYNFIDWMFDDSFIGEGWDKHSIGLVQFRIDNMKRWGLRGWSENTPNHEIRSVLYDHRESIDVLAEFLSYLVSQAPGWQQTSMQAKFSNWDSLSYSQREDVVFQFAAAKDSGSLMNMAGQLSGVSHKAFRLVRGLGVFAGDP